MNKDAAEILGGALLQGPRYGAFHMLTPLNWFDRTFSFADLPLGAYPGVVERLRGTPARLTERVCRLPRDILIRRDGQA